MLVGGSTAFASIAAGAARMYAVQAVCSHVRYQISLENAAIFVYDNAFG